MRGRILKRYLVYELSSPAALGLVVFTFVLFATNLLRLTDLLFNRGVPFSIFIQFVASLLPPLLMVTIPMALLVGVLLGVGRLAADNEIIAMRTSGVNLTGVFAPVLAIALALTGVLWIANGSLIPSLVSLNLTLLKKIEFIVASRLEAGRVFNPKGQMDMALYFRHRNPETHLMEGVTLKAVLTDETGRARTIVLATSRGGRIEPDLDEATMDIILTSGSLHNFDSATSASKMTHYVAKFDEARWRLQLEREKKVKIGRLPQKARELGSWEIRRLLKRGHLDREDEGQLSAEIVQRRSVPMACLAFALLGIPLAIRVRPTGKSVAFSIAFGLIFFYYIMLKWGVSLSQSGSAIGAVVIFLPNVLVGGVGLVLFYRTLRH